MKRTVLFALTALLIAALLCSCGYNTYSIEKIGDVMESSADEGIEDDSVKLTAEIPSEDFLAQTDYYFLFDDPRGDYTPVLFKTDYTVTDVKFFTLKNTQIKDEIIFSKRVLTPDKPLVVDVKTESGLAVRGISFVDPDGRTQYYRVNSDSSGAVVIENVNLLDFEGIEAEAADAELLKDTEGYISYEDKKEEYTKVVYRTLGTVTNFRFLSIEPADTEKEDGRYKISKVLHTVDSFGTEKPFVAETAFADVYASRGISFVDRHGITRYFVISDSASDGKIFIDEVPPMIEKE